MSKRAEIIKEQIMAIRDSGAVNMLDTIGVQIEANNNGFCELVVFIEDSRNNYYKFIFTGDESLLEVE